MGELGGDAELGPERVDLVRLDRPVVKLGREPGGSREREPITADAEDRSTEGQASGARPDQREVHFLRGARRREQPRDLDELGVCTPESLH